MENKSFWLILTLAVVGLGTIFFLTYDPPAQVTVDPDTVNLEIRDEDHVKGNPEAENILVEYIDFRCPACAAAAPLVEQLAEEYGTDLAIVYRYYLVTGGNALPAARAAEAAARQDRFFEMGHILMARQSEWSEDPNATAKFLEYAEELGLDSEQFEADYADRSVTERINQDIAIANQVGAHGTPTFFLNGELIETPGTYEGFAALIEAAIVED